MIKKLRISLFTCCQIFRQEVIMTDSIVKSNPKAFIETHFAFGGGNGLKLVRWKS